MAYEPTVWKSGDVVTSAKLNNIENGIASAALVANGIIDEEAGTLTLDKTWQEIHDAGIAVVAISESVESCDYLPVISIYLMHQVGGSISYRIIAVGFARDGSGQTVMTLETSSADGYPSVQMG